MSARCCRHTPQQVLIKWEEVDGSKVSWKSMAHMLWELVLIRVCYRLGVWGLNPPRS